MGRALRLQTGQRAERYGHIYQIDKVYIRSVGLCQVYNFWAERCGQIGLGAERCGHSYQIDKVIADMLGKVRLRQFLGQALRLLICASELRNVCIFPYKSVHLQVGCTNAVHPTYKRFASKLQQVGYTNYISIECVSDIGPRAARSCLKPTCGQVRSIVGHICSTLAIKFKKRVSSEQKFFNENNQLNYFSITM